MSHTQGTIMAIAAAAGLALTVPALEARLRAASGAGPQQRWNTFSAEVTIRRGVHDSARGLTGNDSRPVIYRWERAHSAGRWSTRMRLVQGGRPEVVTPTGKSQAIPPVIARIEDDADGAGPRFYALDGSLVRPPTRADRRKMGADESVFGTTDALADPSVLPRLGPAAPSGGHDWVDGVLPSREKDGARRAQLERRFGKALGKQRGLDRYVQTLDGDTTEVLAESEWAVPVEVNVVRSGALKSHARFVYEAGPGGSLVRRRSRAEHVIPQGQGARMVLDVELANVTLEERK